MGPRPYGITLGSGPLFDHIVSLSPHRNTNPNYVDVVIINRLEAGVWDEIPLHGDGKNRTGSWVVALGKYSGGTLTYVDGRVVPSHGWWCPFNGRRPHYLTRVTSGKRYGIIHSTLPRIFCRREVTPGGGHTYIAETGTRAHLALVDKACAKSVGGQEWAEEVQKYVAYLVDLYERNDRD